MVRNIILVVAALFLFMPILQAEEVIRSRRDIADLGVTELTLRNGLRVCLKPMASGDEEISLQLFSVGGLAAFPDSSLVPGTLAASIVQESGVGALTGADITKLMFDRWFDFSIKIEPYQRLIEAGCVAETVESVFQLIGLFFSDPHFAPESLSKVVEQMRDAIQHRQQDCESTFEDHYIAINTQGLKILQPLTVDQLANVDLAIAEQVFRRCFSVPSEFTCVIVGNFTIENMISILGKTLATIPEVKTPPQPLVDGGLGIPFPPGVTTHVVKCGTDEENTTRITFPITMSNEEHVFNELEFMTQIIETRLRESIRNKMGTTQAIDVGYEFPQYPHLETKWMNVQFRSTVAENTTLTALTIQELKNLRTTGPTEDEMRDVKLLLQRTDEFWDTESSYWLSTLSNYYKWGWDPSGILPGRQRMNNMTAGQIIPFLNERLSLEQYSVITRQSKE